MEHLGDITEIDWFSVEPVDVVTGGSPCQDLSIAGGRKGLAGERSGLFMEQIRCVKELRRADELRGRSGIAIRPRFMVWENVPGAFSSNKGNDFRAVLEETVKIVCEEAPDVPTPDGGWPKAGCLYDEMGRWSVAWRVHDAQFWGVPQRRKRIALVADFGGRCAPEILFERKGLSWDFEPGEPQGKEAAGGVGERTDKAICIRGNIVGRSEKSGANGLCVDYGKSYTLDATDIHCVFCMNDQGGSQMSVEKNLCGTLSAEQTVAVYDARGNGDGKITPTITGDHNNRVTDYSCIIIKNAMPFDTTQITSPQNGSHPHYGDPCHPLAAGAHAPAIAMGFVMASGQANAEIFKDLSPTLNCNHERPIFAPVVAHALKAKANCQFREDSETYIVTAAEASRIGQTVRRLTPLECERLQGYPDGWTDIGEWTDTKGKKHKPADTPRYKALGNSIALPPNRCFIVWKKTNIPESFTMAMAEYAWSSFDDNAKVIELSSAGIENRFHPTQKPVALYHWIFRNYAKSGDKILDTHLGSGSSRIAAYDMGLDFVGCEIDKEYFEKEEKRFDEHTAQTSLFDLRKE